MNLKRCYWWYSPSAMVWGLEPRVFVSEMSAVPLSPTPRPVPFSKIFFFLSLDMHFRTKQVYSKGEDVVEWILEPNRSCGHCPVFSGFWPTVGKLPFAHCRKTHLLPRHHILVLSAHGLLRCQSTCRSICDHDCKNGMYLIFYTQMALFSGSTVVFHISHFNSLSRDVCMCTHICLWVSSPLFACVEGGHQCRVPFIISLVLVVFLLLWSDSMTRAT